MTRARHDEKAPRHRSEAPSPSPLGRDFDAVGCGYDCGHEGLGTSCRSCLDYHCGGW